MNCKYLNNKTIYLIIIILAVITACYWLHCKFYVNSNNGYIITDLTSIKASLDSNIKKIYVTNYQHVDVGQLLLELENQALKKSLLEAEADLFIAQEKLKIAIIPPKKQPNQHQIKSFKQLVDNKQQIVNQIKINLLNTKIYAPVNGWINNLSVKPLDKVSNNQSLLEIIPKTEKFLVAANFTKDQIKYMQLGQKAKIKLPMYPGYVFNGAVQNTVENLVQIPDKISPRITTVYIEVDNSTFNLPLKIGDSIKVTVHTNPLSKKYSSKKYS